MAIGERELLFAVGANRIGGGDGSLTHSHKQVKKGETSVTPRIQILRQDGGEPHNE